MKFPSINEMAKELAYKAMNEIEIDGKTIMDWVEEVKDYKEKKDKGKIIVLPCKLGNMVYICKGMATFGEIGEKSKVTYRVYKSSFDYWMIPYIGKTVFLTEQEAKKALEVFKI